MKSPFTFRSQSTWAILIFGFISLLIVAEFYLPKDLLTQYGAAALFLGVFAVGITYSIVGSRLKGGPHPHAIVTARHFPSGLPEQRDFFFEVTDPLEREIDVFPLMEMGNYCSKCKKWKDKKETTCKDCGFPTKPQPIPMYSQHRFLWPYIAKTAFGPIEWTDIGEFRKHLFVLPVPWESFFGSHRRRWGAYLLGEQFDKGDSDCVTVYLAPFVHSLLDEPVAVYLGVEGTGTFKKITRNWQKTMNEVMRVDVDKLMEKFKGQLFPELSVPKMLEKAEEMRKEELAEAITR